MRIKIIPLVVAIFLALFMVELALAGSMRCGVHLISDGGRHPPGIYEVLKKCGEPTYRNGSTWVYEFQKKSRKVLRFDEAGLLVRIN